MSRFQSQTVIVTGASLGVGRAAARAFHAEGANVALIARRRGPLDELVAELDGRSPGRAAAWAVDVADVEALARLADEVVARFGGIQGLVNNAGLHHRGPLAGRTAEEIGAMVDVNLRAPLVLTRVALPHLRERGGFVVHVASLAGKVPLDGAATYSATKFGLRAFSFAMAEELRGTGVTVSVVSPGPIDTGFILDDLDQVEDIVFSQAMCTADDVARMIVDCAVDGRLERQFPAFGGRLATLGYLVPALRRLLKPVMVRRGRAAKERIRAATVGRASG